ncbi:MAG: tRNA glutamyl-Q(34) synthetase GluQRS [Gammaproteobacteria bacterium]|nr:tRNA glutamyl-Q(34) synthetase GluQRS [Gammaproteobacteria bacterium]
MYIGRFAPTPSGPLHFGSLITAVASYLDAKAQGGQWLVRIEDIDTPRVMRGAADDILRTLERFGLHWDGTVIYQSQRLDVYRNALNQLAAHSYPCSCSRQELHDHCKMGRYGPIYSGTCRTQAQHPAREMAIRLRTHNTAIYCSDAIQDAYAQCLESEIGDFNLLRRDGYYSYHLAVVVDDAAQHISHVVRGYDLLDSTPRQIYLQQCLGYNTPHYAHVPIALDEQGQKLSKQNHAAALNNKHILQQLLAALVFLGQPTIEFNTPKSILENAIKSWRIATVPQRTQMMPIKY